MEKMIAVILLLLSPLFSKAQSLKAIASGTGQTTGHNRHPQYYKHHAVNHYYQSTNVLYSF